MLTYRAAFGAVSVPHANVFSVARQTLNSSSRPTSGHGFLRRLGDIGAGDIVHQMRLTPDIGSAVRSRLPLRLLAERCVRNIYQRVPFQLRSTHHLTQYYTRHDGRPEWLAVDGSVTSHGLWSERGRGGVHTSGDEDDRHCLSLNGRQQAGKVR